MADNGGDFHWANMPKSESRRFGRDRTISFDAVRQILLKADAKAGPEGTFAEPVSPHGLRAGFVTTAYRNGVPDEEIMGHTRHKSLITMRSYVRRAGLSGHSPAGKLGLSPCSRMGPQT